MTKRKFAMEQDQMACNNGRTWKREHLLGKGGFGSVYLAKLKRPESKSQIYPSVMAVKSAELSESSSLQQEKEVFNNIYGCPFILQCYGEETTFNRHCQRFYNILLEYASGGTLANLIERSDARGLPESDVRRYTRCILEGIRYIHSRGYVHCDLKPENVLLVSTENGDFVPKIADFGLAKKVVKKRKVADSTAGGTTMYMAPETVVDNVQDFPCDIWALGCIVFEMFTGSPLWYDSDTTSDELIKSIGDRHELPEIPYDIPEDGRAFLKKCLVKNPMFRLTADMLLNEPFVSGLRDNKCSDIAENSVEGQRRSCDSSRSKDLEFISKEDYTSSSVPYGRLLRVVRTQGRQFKQPARVC
ncbi:mitogen-activated protein kinase kinase kinase 20-like [Ricinus communis]|uniref:mitogen-activated protein kinase kinase kinase 20-like n=1 Tax=Ricinus communis TaxID=3988 RepID=UPI00201A4ED9|nr:mitogen-activated protein kinase kinase kinase 20-like [Ricinus communis]